MELVADIEAARMDLEVRVLGSQLVEIKVAGELEEGDLRELRVQLLDGAHGGRAAVLLDLSRVEQIDATTMALLMLARIEIEARGGTFVVQAARSRIREALRRAGIDRFVEIVESRVEALSAVGRPALDTAA